MKQEQQRTYKRDDVVKKTMDYFNDALCTDVWINKYCLKNSEGDLFESSPEDMHRRLAKEFARIEEKYDDSMSENEIFELLHEFRYVVPQGSPMAGIGNNNQITSLGNCFVVGNDADSYSGILRLEEEMIHLMKRRGGVGLDLSHIRPRGMAVNNAAIASTGVVPFMERYSNGTREVAQDGRRGALMLTISDSSPNMLDFISAKLDPKMVTGANVSVKLSDEFMQAVLSDVPFIQKHNGYYYELNAKDTWNKIIENSWKSAEPGVLFWSRIISESPADCYVSDGFKTVSTNPCGEIPLSVYDSCRLIAINLYSFIENPFTKASYFNKEKFNEVVYKAQRLMDDLIDLEEEKIDLIIKKIESDKETDDIKRTELNLWNKIKHSLQMGRRTGLGVVAEADMQAALGIKYGTEESIQFSEMVHKEMATAIMRSSIALAKQRGSFPIFSYNKEKYNPFINRILSFMSDEDKEDYKTYGRRNIATSTIAPTGSVSILTKTTSGIEPVFMTYYTRRRKINPNDKDVKVSFIDDKGDHWEEYNIIHPKLIVWGQVNGYNLENMSKTELDDNIKKSPYSGATSSEIDWSNRVRLQGVIQKYVDHSISSTVNLPETATLKDVDNVFITAWKSGCKGITVYRDKCRSGVLVAQSDKKINVFQENHAPKRPRSLKCDILRFTNRGEKWIGFLGLYDEHEPRPYEIFTGPASQVSVPHYITHGEIIKEKNENNENIYNFRYKDSDGYSQEFKGLSRIFNREYWNIGRLVSAILRHGMPLPNLITLLDKLELDNDHISNWKNGVKRILKHYIKEGTTIKEECPECKMTTMIYKDGCSICTNCGYSKCG